MTGDHAWRLHDLSGGPSLGILRYGTSPTWPAPDRQTDPSAHGYVTLGPPYGFVGSCTSCLTQVLGDTYEWTADAIERHVQRRHL